MDPAGQAPDWLGVQPLEEQMGGAGKPCQLRRGAPRSRDMSERHCDAALLVLPTATQLTGTGVLPRRLEGADVAALALEQQDYEFTRMVCEQECSTDC